MNPDVLSPGLTLLAKLSAIVVHTEEWLSDHRHENDLTALRAVLSDTEVQEWMQGMTKLALAPLKRKERL